MYPGNGQTHMFTEFYTVNAKTKVLEDAWKFAKFLGGNGNGDWYVQRQWCLIAGLDNPYPGDVRPPGDHPVVRQVDRSQAPARAVQEGRGPSTRSRSRGSPSTTPRPSRSSTTSSAARRRCRRASRSWSRCRSPWCNPRLARGPHANARRGRAPSLRGGVRLAARPAGRDRDRPRGGRPARLLSLALVHRRQSAAHRGARAGGLRDPSAALPLGGPQELPPGLRRPALLELALAHPVLRGRVRGRGDAGRHGDGAGAQRALRRAAADAEPPADPVVALPDRGRPPVGRPARLRVRGAERRCSTRRA